MADEFEFVPDPLFGAGTWSNHVRVIAAREALVIDFIVLDPLGDGGVIVSRVALPLGAAVDLRDSLVEGIDDYTGKQRPS